MAYKLLCIRYSGNKSNRVRRKGIIKKSNVLIAAVAEIIATSAAKAGDMELNFDGKSKLAVSFAEFVNTVPVSEIISPTSVVQFEAKEIGPEFFKMEKASRQALRTAISKAEGGLFDRNITSLINDEKTDILYNNMTVIFVGSMGENKYRTLLESSDNRLIHFFAVNAQVMPQTKQLLQAVSVCGLVEVLGGAYIIKKTGEIWEQVWVETKKLVKECHTEYVEVSDNGGSGGTYHNGQGGSSDYDVEKHLK